MPAQELVSRNAAPAYRAALRVSREPSRPKSKSTEHLTERRRIYRPYYQGCLQADCSASAEITTHCRPGPHTPCLGLDPEVTITDWQHPLFDRSFQLVSVRGARSEHLV